jgi:RNA polymerase sigma-70 factor (ECF subfamily)
MRLCTLLVENLHTNKPQVNALLSLMCFHASRFEARIDTHGSLVLYEDQNIHLWNSDLISRGMYFLNCAASGDTLSKYHLEAAIASWHTQKSDTKEKWEAILQLYNRLLQVEYSPMAALNRTYALAKANGKQQAIAEAEKLRLLNNHFYYLLLGELYTGIDTMKARQHFRHALTLTKTQPEKDAIQKKLDKL